MSSDANLTPQSGNDTPYHDVAGGVASVTVGEPIAMPNEAGTDHPTSPRVAQLKNGNLVTVWAATTSSTLDNGIYAQLHDSAGIPIGEAFNITPPGDARHQLGPDIAVLADGAYVVTYTSADMYFGNSSVAYRVVQANGTIGEEHLIAPGPGQGLFPQAVVPLAEGGFVLAWTTGEGGTTYQLCDASGAPAPVPPYTPFPDTIGVRFDMAQLNAGGFAAAWGDYPSNKVMVALFDEANLTGSGDGKPPVLHTLTAEGPSEQYLRVQVAALDNGNFVVVWNTGEPDMPGEVWFQVMDPAGGYVGETFTASTDNKPVNREPTVAALADGGFVIAWESSTAGSDRDVVARRFDNDGTARDDAEFQVDLQHALSDETMPSLTPLAGGGFVAAWDDMSTDGSFSAQIAIVHPSAQSNPAPVDMPPPTAKINLSSNMQLGGDRGTFSFSVTYTDYSGKGLDTASFGTGNVIAVTSSGAQLQVQSFKAEGNTVTYTVAAPGGFWDGADSGYFRFNLVTGSVKDLAGKAVAALERPVQSFAWVPTANDLYDDAATVSAAQAVVTTLTADDDSQGVWTIDDETEEGLFAIVADPSGRTAQLRVLDPAKLPPVGESVFVTAHYYGAYEVDLDGNPLPNQGVTHTLRYTVTEDGVLRAPMTSAAAIEGAMIETSETPSVATLANGSYVTVWKSDGVHAQVFDKAGHPAGDAVAISAAGIDHYHPAVTALKEGGYVVSYQMLDAAFEVSVAYRVIGADGSLGSEHVVAPGAGWDSEPTVAAKQDGGFVVAWVVDGIVNVRHIGANGDYQSDETRIVTSGSPWNIDVAGLKSGGYVVSWVDGDSDAVQVAVYPTDFVEPGNGTPDTVPARIVNVSTDAGGASVPHVAALADGGFVVVWDSDVDGKDSGKVLFQRFDAFGTHVGERGVANVLGGDNVLPDVAPMSDGGFVISWRSDNGDKDYQVHGRRFDAEGKAIDALEFAISNDHGVDVDENPAVTGLADGNFAAVWMHGSAGSDITGLQTAVVAPVAPPPAPTGPTATIDVDSQLQPAGTATTLSFTVTYTDHSGKGLDPESVGANNISVSSYGRIMRVVSHVLDGDTVTYTVEAPGGSWDMSDRGMYEITLGADPVRDKAGTAATAEQGASFDIAIPVPTEVHDNANTVWSDQLVVTTLTPTGYDGPGRWQMDRQSVDGLFTLVESSSGNGAELRLADKDLLPQPGATVSVTMHYYGQYQLDAEGNPLPYQGVERTLHYLVTDGGEMLALPPSAMVGADQDAQTAARAVTTLANGNYVIVWETRELDSRYQVVESALHAEVRDPQGRVVSEQITLTQPGDRPVPSDIEVAALQRGGYVLTYEVGPADNNAVAYRIVGADGTVGAETILAGEVGYMPNPTVNTLSDGSLLFAWTDGARVVMQRMSVDGEPIGDQAWFDTGNQVLNLDLITLENGSQVLSWGDGPQQSLFFAQYGAGPAAADGVPDMLEPVIRQIADPIKGYQGGPVANMAALADGGFVLVFNRVQEQMSLKGDVYFQRYDEAGVLKDEGTVNVSSGPSHLSPFVAALSNGGFVVTWTSENGDGDQQALGRRYDADGKAVDAFEFVISDDRTPDRDSSPIVTALTDGNFAAVWSHATMPGRHLEIRTSVMGGGGTQPTDPTPENPTPVDPTPVDPTPVDPTPVDPTPVDPTPVDPTPVDPTPVDPTPVDPTPVDPTPVDPSDGTVHGTIDGVDVDTTPATTSTGASGIVVNVPVITVTRAEDPTTPHQTLADIPLAVQAADGSSQTLLTVSLPVNAGMRAEGPAALQSNAQALLDLIARIEARTAFSSSAQAEMKGEGKDFLGALGQDVLLQTATLTPSVAGNAAPERILITGNSVSGASTGTAIGLVIDAKGLSSSTVLQLDNVDFAAIVGAATLRGGEGRNYVVGDDAEQSILLGADDDLLYGGGGNDRVGSAGGNDLLHGGDGDDIVVGGIGNDSLWGDAGDDMLQGGRSDSGAWQFTLGADGTLAAQHELAVFAPGTREGVTMAELDLDNAALGFLGASHEQLTELALLYHAAFGRAPDLEGINFYAGKPVTSKDVAALMMTSAEWAASGMDALDDNAFVQKVYQQALDRVPDESGLAFWLGKLAGTDGTRITRAEMIEAVALSPEHRGLVGADGSVTIGVGTLATEQGWFADSGDDLLMGGAGSDLLVGGDGFDTVVYDGARTDYKVVLGANGAIRVEDKANGDLDTLRGIEAGAFGDGTVDLAFTQAAPETLAQVGTLYHALFGREGDFGGFTWWVSSGVKGAALVECFVQSDEFKAKYDGLDDAHFVQALFQSAGLAQDAAGGVQAWQDYLSGHSRAELVGAWVGNDAVVAAQLGDNGLWLV